MVELPSRAPAQSGKLEKATALAKQACHKIYGQEEGNDFKKCVQKTIQEHGDKLKFY